MNSKPAGTKKVRPHGTHFFCSKFCPKAFGFNQLRKGVLKETYGTKHLKANYNGGACLIRTIFTERNLRRKTFVSKPTTSNNLSVSYPRLAIHL